MNPQGDHSVTIVSVMLRSKAYTIQRKKMTCTGLFKKRIFVCFVIFFLSPGFLSIYGENSHKGKTIYSYGDGSGNTYVVAADGKKTVEYKPVTPEMSSSGIYSGGDYVKKEISQSQYQDIVSSLQKAVKNKKIHIKERVKTSGLITVQKNKTKKVYIIKPNSKEQINIEKVLKEIIK